MKRSHFSLGTILAASLLAAAARAQSYGPDDQILTVGAAEFRSLDASDASIDEFGYLRQGGVHLAPLRLPPGSVIETLCLFAQDSESGAANFVRSHIVAIKQVPQSETPGLEVVGPEAFTDNSGYQKSCVAVGETVRGRLDVDGDGAADAVAYYVHVQFPDSPSGLAAGGVQITWRRQVSTGFQQTFDDVAPTDPAFDHIEALAASGVTAGCTPTDYCPDANLTRRQMAVFLAKALGLHWAD
jgi:hypothetical protein